MEVASESNYEIRELFNIDPSDLTAQEAGYLSGFRDADELRNRVAKARQERSARLLSKGLRTSATETVTASGFRRFALDLKSCDRFFIIDLNGVSSYF